MMQHMGVFTHQVHNLLDCMVRLIETLIDQTFRINSTWSGFHYDILNLKSVLQKNEFPLKLIDKSISNYLSNNVFKQKENEQMPL